MSARTDGYLTCFFVARHGVSDAGLLAESIVRLCSAFPSARYRMSYAARGKRGKIRKTHTMTVERLREVLGYSFQEWVQFWAKGGDDVRAPDGVHGFLFVGDDPADPGAVEWSRRWSGLIMPGVAHLTECVAFLREMDALFGVIGGGLAWHPTWDEAEREAFGGGDYEKCDPDLVERVRWDAENWRRSHTALRRLYPITIIGHEIWAGLPPMPAFDPRPKLEDLGTCKLLTAWPALCDPHDPQFLLGTRDLRRWLWPYTVGNPADDPDAVDRRLRELGLL